MQKLDEQAKRQEDILITLINVQKEFTTKIVETNTEMKAIYKTFLEVVKALKTSNGFKK